MRDGATATPGNDNGGTGVGIAVVRDLRTAVVRQSRKGRAEDDRRLAMLAKVRVSAA